jgi:N-carbamoylputrescine amidase
MSIVVSGPRPASDTDSFAVGLVQMRCVEDPKRNLDVALEAIRVAASHGAQIVCLQELFRTPYFCQSEDSRHFDLAEEIPGHSTQVCSAVAKELGVVLIVPIFERRASGLYHNSAVVINTTGDLLGVYRKQHIPDDPQYFEKFYFTPGDLGYAVFNTQFARIGVLICWDQWYPEAARLMALQGAEIIFYPTAIGGLKSENDDELLIQRSAWQTMQQSHAIANGIYVAAANRVGYEGDKREGITFWGGSFVCDPRGQVVAEATRSEGDVLVAACSRQAMEQQRRNWPFLRDRRIDTYEPITRRFLDGDSAVSDIKCE